MRLVSVLMVTLSLLCVSATAQAAPRVFIAGDSTAAHYGPERYPQMGWGMVLSCHLSADIAVVNRAMGGRSTKSFIAEGRYDALATDLAPGDVLLIQFGHNDATIAKPERYTPLPDFRVNLLRFVAMARSTGAVPVLLTPVAIRQFEAGIMAESLAPYANATRAVAAETGVALIDLNLLSRIHFTRIGEEPSKANYLHYGKKAGYPRWPDGIADNVHFSEVGARAVAALVAARLHELPLPIAASVIPGTPDNPPTLGNADCR